MVSYLTFRRDGGATTRVHRGARWRGGVAAVTRGQQPERMRRIGVLLNITANDPESQTRLAAFAQGLQLLGWIIGQNVRVDYRWGNGSADALIKYAAELLALAPDVILAQSTAAVAPLLRLTHTVPIVFTAVADPVAAGYVQTLARPGGNATGFTGFEYAFAGKWLEFLKEIAPGVKRAAVLREAGSVTGPAQFGAIQAVAPRLGVELRAVDTHDVEEIERTITAFAQDANGGIIVTEALRRQFTVRRSLLWRRVTACRGSTISGPSSSTAV